MSASLEPAPSPAPSATPSTPLLDAFLSLLWAWRPVFCQERTFLRSVRLALALVFTPGRRMLSRIITSCGLEQQDWSGDYKLFSRADWNAEGLFEAVLSRCLKIAADERFIHVAGDITHVRKTGKKVAGVHCMRDPMSPAFHVNLIYGLKFLQFTCVLPLYRTQPDASPRSVPVLFEEMPALQKPGKRATQEQKAAHAKAQKERRGMNQTIAAMQSLRQRLDDLGCKKMMLATLDGGFCNRTIFRAPLERTEIICRTRKDARLCRQAAPGGRRFFASEKFTPEALRQDETIEWKQAELFHGGEFRQLRYKEITPIYWQSGAQRKPLRLIIIAPTPYRLHKAGRIHYRQPAYLLTTDLTTPAAELAQAYFDHWQIEVNHRDEKSIMGVGEAQVRNARSVPRQPAFAVAIYSLLQLAVIQAYGLQRTTDYLPLPKWRKHARRPSCSDMIAQLRREMDQAGHKLLSFKSRDNPLTSATLMAAA